MLEIREVHVYYGAIHALKGVSLTVERGELVTLIGANGAGKTTTLKTLSGLLRPKRGAVLLEGQTLQRTEAHEIVRRGVGQRCTHWENSEKPSSLGIHDGDVHHCSDEQVGACIRYDEIADAPSSKRNIGTRIQYAN